MACDIHALPAHPSPSILVTCGATSPPTPLLNSPHPPAPPRSLPLIPLLRHCFSLWRRRVDDAHLASFYLRHRHPLFLLSSTLHSWRSLLLSNQLHRTVLDRRRKTLLHTSWVQWREEARRRRERALLRRLLCGWRAEAMRMRRIAIIWRDRKVVRKAWQQWKQRMQGQCTEEEEDDAGEGQTEELSLQQRARLRSRQQATRSRGRRGSEEQSGARLLREAYGVSVHAWR